ncbi:hypothetical protein OG848_36730 [Streptomyces canus]|uniref:hypothetical protein n=1 Tax=Streptomyces canus TaxID=58343 RepID=UPI00324CA8DC
MLRHTYASVILEAGESVVTLARWLGHSSPTITLDYYAHFMPEAGRQGARGHRCPAQPLRRRCHGRLDVQFAQGDATAANLSQVNVRDRGRLPASDRG